MAILHALSLASIGKVNEVDIHAQHGLLVVGQKQVAVHKGNNKITELQTNLQRESQNS